MHRLHEMFAALSRRRDRRRTPAHAHRRRRALHGLRTMRRALPRGLHRDDPVAQESVAVPGPAGRFRLPRALPRSQRTHRPQRGFARRHTGREEAWRPLVTRERYVNAAKRRVMFERFRAPNPHPTTELEYERQFVLVVAVILSAQATDKSVNAATRKLFPVARTPQAIAKLGVAGLAK